MSAADHLGIRTGALGSWLRRIEATVRASTATLLRPPRGPVARWGWQQWVAVVLLAAAVTLVTMPLADAWAVNHARTLPAALVAAARRFTDFGRSGWFLWPIGIVLLTLTIFENPVSTRVSRGIVAAFAVRLGFVFLAIGLPGLFATIIKRIIGRARPFVAGNNIWAYDPFSWQPRYASFPSGHVTTAFAALFAIGALFPQARALMWIYAVMIAVTRVMVTAHYPSDGVAGAFVGVVGALLVRNWFAARRLGFAVDADGSVRPMPGPSVWRIVKAVAHRPHCA
jgi:membrane-associated phospholipid phosphatase